MNNNYFPDTTKMAPLTLEQLREMANQPYWHVGLREDSGAPHWSILDPLLAYHPEDYDYGKTWIAYAYQPAHIDREAWEPCKKCKSCASCTGSIGDPNSLPCSQCEQYCNYIPRNFCPECGRPLTPEAWAELEKRLRG